MKININPADHRGFVDHGWIKSWHSFSFGDYFNPVREKFGVIRVLNDEVLAPSASFDYHEHKNLEILVLPIKGKLIISDDSKNQSILQGNDVQLVSAGKRIEFTISNALVSDSTELIQIWIFPKFKNTEPIFMTGSLPPNARKGQLQLIAVPRDASYTLNDSPAPLSSETNLLRLNQDVWVSRIDLENQGHYSYNLFNESNQLLVFVIEGNISVEPSKNNISRHYVAKRRDTVEIQQIINTVEIYAQSDSSLLLIETPVD